MESAQPTKKPFSVCITGHRPNRLPTGEKLRQIYRLLAEELRLTVAEGAQTFYCGMATGIDMAAGEMIVKLKETHPQLRLIAVIPFPEQAASYPPEDRARYDALMQAADEVVCTSSRFRRDCYQIRNYYMVDHSDHVIGVSVNRSTGTGQTLAYAERKRLHIHWLSAVLNPPYFQRY